MTEDTHEMRKLKWKVKSLSKQNGRQGDTIHHLRAELAEVRELNSKIDRGELRRLIENVVPDLILMINDRDEKIDHLQGEVRVLNEKLELHEKLAT